MFQFWKTWRKDRTAAVVADCLRLTYSDEHGDAGRDEGAEADVLEAFADDAFSTVRQLAGSTAPTTFVGLMIWRVWLVVGCKDAATRESLLVSLASLCIRWAAQLRARREVTP